VQSPQPSSGRPSDYHLPAGLGPAVGSLCAARWDVPTVRRVEDTMAAAAFGPLVPSHGRWPARGGEGSSVAPAERDILAGRGASSRPTPWTTCPSSWS
jgi:hypothetical protein